MKAQIVGSLLITTVLTLPINASMITGGSELITGTSLDLLDTWLGQGEINLTNVFTKQAGSTVAGFHTAVDGLGATFSIMEITDGISTEIIGGYNPQSWGLKGWNLSVTDETRNAFIFNLTTSTVLNQKLIADGDVTSGQYQTYNNISYGPAFGGGTDLAVYYSLDYGQASQFSYGTRTSNAGNGYTTQLTSIYKYRSGVSQVSCFDVKRLEVFTVSPEPVSSVPEPSLVSVLACGLLSLSGMGLLRRKK